MPCPSLHIHPESAARSGIADGDEVEIRSPHGVVRARAELWPGIRRDTVMMPHGWWQGCAEMNLPDLPLLDGGANVNLLYSPDDKAISDPLISAMGSQTLVSIRKIREN